MFRRVYAAFFRVRALSAASRGRPDLGLTYLDRISQKYSSDISFTALQLALQMSVGKNRTVVENVPLLISRIKKEKTDDDRRRYMIAFLQLLGNCAGDALYRSGDGPPALELDVDWQKIDLANVPDRMKRHFPLRDHPKWLR